MNDNPKVLWTQTFHSSSFVLASTWNPSTGKLSRLMPVFGSESQKTDASLEISELDWGRLPYGVASVIRELYYFFQMRGPMLPFPWALVEDALMTPFQKQVYETTLSIPFGETRSYAWIAEKIKNPRAVRAVGQALRKNPFAILIPCHRVVTCSGALGGYMGERKLGSSPLQFKESLLALERGYINPSLGSVFQSVTGFSVSTGANSYPL